MWLNRLTVSLRPIWGMYWRFGFDGAADEIPPSGPLLVAANHASFLDPWFISILFPRPVHHLINRRWYEKSALWKAFFRANGTVPISPDDPDATYGAIESVFERGAVLGIFPEGRISHDGRIQRMRSGVAFIAARSGVPVVPIGIRGAYDCIPRQKRFPRPGPVSIRVGSPMTFPDAPTSSPSRGAIRAFRESLQNEICRLSGQHDRMVKRARPAREPDLESATAASTSR